MSVMEFSTPLLERREIAEETVELRFERPADFSFAAGQFVNLSIDLQYEDARGDTRSFSLASSPNENVLRVAFRISESGFKQTLLSMDLGETVSMQGPFGHFTLPEEEARIAFVAGGIGITPVLSMVRYATEEHLPHEIDLLYANDTRERAGYRDALVALEEHNTHLTLHPIYGPVTRKAVEDMFSAEREWYVVGPPGMVDATCSILDELNISDTHVHTEQFAGYD